MPFLRSIPVLGQFFRARQRVELKSTLLVTVRAEVESADQQALSRALQRELTSSLSRQDMPGPASPAPSQPAPGAGPHPVPRS